MTMRTLIILASLSTAVLGGTLMEEVTNAGATILIDLLKNVSLDKSLETDYLTIFAPSNEAFANLPDDLAKRVTSNATILASVLEFHATRGIFRAQDAFDNLQIDTTLPGAKIRVNAYNGASQGSMFITTNGAKVLKADIQASNGIVHVIDKVMLPPVGNFYDLLTMSTDHTALKSLVDQNGLKQVLESTTGTLFAPNNKAFEDLNNYIQSKNVQGQPVGEAMKEIIMYHMLRSVVYSAGAMNATYVTADKAEKLTISVAADLSTAKINQANVVIPDIAATNGVIHIIDSVLIPEPYATGLAMLP